MLVLIVMVLVSACGGGSVDPGGGSTVAVSIEIVDGAPTGGVQDISSGRGDSIVVSISGESTDRVHIHGYDLFVDVVGEITFDALIPGVFELELEDSGRLLAKLTVS